MTDTWKKVERRVAKTLGGRRTGPTGKEGPDVLTDWLAVECKHRAKLPAWVAEALRKIRAQAGPDRLGLVVLHQAGDRDSVVMLSLRDFADWFGQIPTDGEACDGDQVGNVCAQTLTGATDFLKVIADDLAGEGPRADLQETLQEPD